MSDRPGDAHDLAASPVAQGEWGERLADGGYQWRATTDDEWQPLSPEQVEAKGREEAELFAAVEAYKRRRASS